MKIRHLPEVELANLTSLALDEQRSRMVGLTGGGGIFSFEPTREQFPDILNTQFELFRTLGPTPVTEFSVIESALKRRCKVGAEAEFNLLVSKLLYSHFRSENVISRECHFAALPVGLGRSVRYWIPAYYGRAGLPVLTFIDPRGGRNLTGKGRDVVFSVMHAAIRERYPDFGDATLQVIQTPYAGGPRGTRKHRDRVLKVYNLAAGPAFDFDELDIMLTRTLILWDEVCAWAAEETRKRADGSGSLL